MIPLVKPVTGDERGTAIIHWQSVWVRATHQVLLGRNDKQTKDLSRYFYPPSAPLDVAVFVRVGEGLALDWEALPPAPAPQVSADGRAAAGDVDYLGYATLQFLVFGAPKGEQRGRALAATRALLSAGYSVEETAEKVWEGLRKSVCGDPDDPWTHEHAVAFAQDLANRKPTPLSPRPIVELAPPPAGARASSVSPLPPRSAPAARAPQIAVPPFPVEVLPEVARGLVFEGASAMGAPPDMIGVPLLGYVGAAIGRRQEVQLKQGWWERPVL